MSALSDILAATPIGRRRRLTRAAGIASAILICHPETWDRIQSLAGALKPERAISGTASQGDAESGLAEVTLSGTGLAMLMQAMHEVMVASDIFFARDFPPHDRAVARRVYLAAARVVMRVGPDQAAAVPRIVLDDRISP